MASPAEDWLLKLVSSQKPKGLYGEKKPIDETSIATH
jgi:hypothetical protein